MPDQNDEYTMATARFCTVDGEVGTAPSPSGKHEMSVQSRLRIRDMSKRQERIDKALDVIERYGGNDGGHHKQWVLDQVVRELLGDRDRYAGWVQAYESGDDGPKTYIWETGIAP